MRFYVTFYQMYIKLLQDFRTSLAKTSFTRMQYTDMRLEFIFILTLFLMTLCYDGSQGSQGCKKRLLKDQDCNFEVSDFWDFRTFREWLDQKGSLGDVSLNISCIKGGSVYIPWPFRARNLKRVKVTNCYLKGYYDEYKVLSNYEDSLQQRIVANNVIEINVPEWFDSVVNSKPEKSIACGQESLERDIISNNTYRFSHSSFLQNRPVDFLVDALHTMRENRRSQPFKCHYSNLVYLEKSCTHDLGKHFMEDITLHSNFPKLLSLNLSSNSMWHLPVELKQWYETFPQLEYLDLSNCKLQSFSFSNPTPYGRETSIHINLQNNNISDVPQMFDQYATWSPPISIDLRGNPFLKD